MQDLPAMTFGKRQPTGYRGVERRRNFRERVDLSTHVVLPAGQFIKCRVTDLSNVGARISVPSVFALPDAFELRGIGRACHVRLVHRGVGYAGVQFI